MIALAFQQNSIKQKIPALLCIAIIFCTLTLPSKATQPNNPIANIANRITVHYDLALQKNSKLRDAYNNRVLARYGLGDIKGALKDYDQAIQLEPTRASLYKNRGFIYSASGNRQAAQLDLQKAADLYRSQADTDHYNEVLEQIRKMKQVSPS